MAHAWHRSLLHGSPTPSRFRRAAAMTPEVGRLFFVMLSALSTPATSFLITSTHLRLRPSTHMSRALPSATTTSLAHRSGRHQQQQISSCGAPSRRSFISALEPAPSPSRRRRIAAGVSGPLRIGLGDCPSEEECEIVYDDDDDDEDDIDEGASSPVVSEEKTAEAEGEGESPPESGGRDSGSDSDREEGAEGKEGAVEGKQQQQQQQQSMSLPEVDREGLEHKEKVLDDGYEKQDMVKWREAEVVTNTAASADDRCRLLTLSLVGGVGLEYDFSRATWLDNYKVPGQFVGIRLDEGGDNGVAGCLVAVSTEPTLVRQKNGNVEVLVTEEPSFRLKGDTRGPAEEAKGRSLASLEEGDRVKISDFMGRGFASLFVGWIGLQSALQEQRDIVIVASGARGLGSVKPVLDWPPVQAHAGIKKVSVFLESENPAAAPFMNESGGWRSSGIRVTQCYTAKTNENPVSVEAAMFSHGSGLAGAVGGSPGAASFLMAGLPGKRAMELTDRLTDHGVDPSRLLFNDFF